MSDERLKAALRKCAILQQCCNDYERDICLSWPDKAGRQKERMARAEAAVDRAKPAGNR